MDLNSAPVSKNLIIINVLVWLAFEVLHRMGIVLDSMFALHMFAASDFRWYQLITYQFMHGSFMHVFFNMLAVFWFGPVMERTWGARKFLFFYVFCGIGAALTQELVQYIYYFQIEHLDRYNAVMIDNVAIPVNSYLNFMQTVGASGCVFGILLAFGMFYPNEQMFVFPIPFPLKAKCMVAGYAAFELVTGMKAAVGDNVAHFAHLGGMLFGLLIILYWKKYGDYRLPLGLEPLINENCPKERNIFNKIKNLFAGREKRDFKVHKNESFSEKKTEQRQQPRPKRDPEIDAMLKKVRESGYDSLTTEEKRKLFNGY